MLDLAKFESRRLARTLPFAPRTPVDPASCAVTQSTRTGAPPENSFRRSLAPIRRTATEPFAVEQLKRSGFPAGARRIPCACSHGCDGTVVTTVSWRQD